MKKLLFACSFAICIAAIAMSGNIGDTGSKPASVDNSSYYSQHTDTIPGKKSDTTKRKKPIPPAANKRIEESLADNH